MKKNDHEIKVVAECRNIVGETPVWHPVEQRLYWVDTRAPTLNRLETDGSVTTWKMPANIGSYVFTRSGDIIAALQTGFHKLDLDGGKHALIVDPEPDKPDNRLNDGRCDRRGRYWCGSRDPGNDNPGGSLFRLDPDRTCRRMDTGFIVANGMAFSPDDETMIFGDSRGDIMWRYRLDMDSGEIREKTPFLDTSHVPWRVDGATFDAEGYYWAALIGAGAIGRFDPTGRLDRFIPVPVTHPTMCAFGGENLDVMYVTSGTVFLDEEERKKEPLAGALFSITGLGVKGMQEPLFAS
ncbi:sugar lactone lactonase YvrE [Cupriavidus gilardii J11]|uniref:Regucalcin n=1 Tax=Cupriavidus gilardii J11 TaxID=936133 RepID=A0A562BQK0_9BURK|nr:SMP-30/gluconolactonase/LRE family protein [Cupriavidus gilardii]TWG87441.1 sugar lactone lactonase YvrE [Cupriavidus gilardii J11]